MDEAILVGSITYVAARRLERDELAHWLWETWRLVKQTFPLLIAGYLFGAFLAR